MFTNRRPPPKSPAGTTSSSSTLAPPPPPPLSSASTSSMTLSDRIKTQVRSRPVIQTKVQTVVKTITRPVIKPTTNKSNAKGKAPVRTNGNGKGGGNASKSKPRNSTKSSKPSTASSSDEQDSNPSSSSKRKKNSEKESRSIKRSRSTSSSLSSTERGGGNGNRDGYESSSSLSSADEDYFSGRLGGQKPVEGLPVCVRNVAALPVVEGEGGQSFKIVHSEEIVRANLNAYVVDFFADPANPQATAMDWCGHDLPIVELEYPAVGARERFALVAPKRDDEYNPIEDLMVTIETILENYLTPAQALSHFGYTPGSSFSSFSSFLKPLSSSSHHLNQHSSSSSSSTATTTATPPITTTISNPTSRSSSPAIHRIGTPKLSTPEPSTIVPATSSSSSSSTFTTVEPLLRSLEKARNRRDGPTFFSHLERFNQTLDSLKKSTTTSTSASSPSALDLDGTTTTTNTTNTSNVKKNVIEDNVSKMAGLREKVWTKVFHQCYDRTVGPDIEELRKYAAFSDNVYGELLPKFMNEIFGPATENVLGPGKVFVDLGSGVGNCVVQAALATGADSFGFENMPHASHLARLQLGEAKERFKLWGLSSGGMECIEADFCENDVVPKVLKKADVVLVNNEVFTAALNDKLAYLFLDLPDDCYLVSLKPFLPPSFKLSSHNRNHPLAYLSQKRGLYRPGSVSWKMEGGSYFIAKVERGKLERWVTRQEAKELERKKEREDKRSRRSESSQAMSRNGSRQQ